MFADVPVTRAIISRHRPRRQVRTFRDTAPWRLACRSSLRAALYEKHRAAGLPRRHALRAGPWLPGESDEQADWSATLRVPRQHRPVRAPCHRPPRRPAPARCRQDRRWWTGPTRRQLGRPVRDHARHRICPMDPNVESVKKQPSCGPQSRESVRALGEKGAYGQSSRSLATVTKSRSSLLFARSTRDLAADGSHSGGAALSGRPRACSPCTVGRDVRHRESVVCWYVDPPQQAPLADCHLVAEGGVWRSRPPRARDSWSRASVRAADLPGGDRAG